MNKNEMTTALNLFQDALVAVQAAHQALGIPLVERVIGTHGWFTGHEYEVNTLAGECEAWLRGNIVDLQERLAPTVGYDDDWD